MVTTMKQNDLELPQPKYLWHYKFHTDIADEHLCFLIVAFTPDYRPKQATRRLLRALKECGARSWAVWELIGEDDVLLQAWLPRRVDPEALEEELRRSGGASIRSMHVNKVLYHWMWDRDVTDQQMLHEVESSHWETLNVPGHSIKPSELRNYVEKKFIHKLPRYSSYKFFMRLSNPQSLDGEQRARIDELCQLVMEDERISGGSVLSTSGNGGMWLVSGRFRYSDLEMLTEAFDVLTGDGLLSALNIRTTTHISSRRGPMLRQEILRQSATTARPLHELDRSYVETLLRQPEGQELELKSAAYSDIDFLASKRPHRQDEKARFADITKAVSGMLNGEGGVLIVGVAEGRQYGPQHLSRLRSRVPGLTDIADRIVLGIEADFRRNTEWDDYERRFRQDLRNSIDGEVGGVSLKHVPWGETISLCVVQVKQAPSDVYAKVRNQGGKGTSLVFYGRDGGETRKYEGTEIARYRRAHPRVHL